MCIYLLVSNVYMYEIKFTISNAFKTLHKNIIGIGGFKCIPTRIKDI